MTWFEPTLVVERMRVERDAAVAYDEAFHVGVNIIRGDNSSGKSTILNFLFYALGGDLSDWSAAARLCTRVLVQVRLNDAVATLARDVSLKPKRPMDLFPGDMNEALIAPHSEWLRFGYSRSEARDSFSQALFRLMNVPEVVTDASGNITMNQLLRLLYADQLSPVESLFKHQGIFDNADHRDAIGRLLFGSHSVTLYENEQEIRRLGGELDQVIGEFRTLLSVVGADEGMTWDWLQAERARLAARSEELASEIAEGGAPPDHADEPTLRAQEDARVRIVALQALLGREQDERSNLALRIADSARFIEALRSKLVALNDTSLVASTLGDVRFNECPACSTPLDDDPPPHACYLCKAPHDEEDRRGRLTALITETALQIDQSEQLQRRRLSRAEEADEKIWSLTREWESAARQLAELRQTVSTERELRLRELNREAGYVSRQLEDLARREEVARRLQGLSERRAGLQSTIEKLRAENEALQRQQQHRIGVASTAVSDEIRTLLKNDLRRQDAFEAPSSIAFSFRDNRISVNEESYFSASSRAILKSSFVLGLTAAAMRLNFMRHPRFCMIDTHENMGVEAIRSQNFQRQILRVSEESRVDHQIIFATAMLADELDEPRFLVGRHYTRDAPSLDLAT
jgi:rubrerythrin